MAANEELSEHSETKESLAPSREEIQQECKCRTNVNRELLPSKLFYFFFFGANGTLMPYLVLFFKQLGLSPSQVGIVTGFKPFISFFFTPVWGYIADKWKKNKLIYVISLLAYIGGYFAYSFAPAKHVCKLKTNSTKHQQMFGMHMHRRFQEVNFEKRELLDKYFQRIRVLPKESQKKDFVRSSDTNPIFPNMYPEEISVSLFQMPTQLQLTKEEGKGKENMTKKAKHNGKRNISAAENMLEKVKTIEPNPLDFLEPSWDSAIEFHKSPWSICAAARADAKTSIISNYAEKVTAYADINAIFTYLLVVTVVATLFSCPLITLVDTATIRQLKETNNTHKYGKQRLWGSLGWGITSFGVGAIISMIPLCPGTNNEVNYYPAFYVFAVLLLVALVIGLKLRFSLNGEETNDAQRSRTGEIVDGLKLMKEPSFCFFIIISFYIGITMSIIKTFLFWHLKDIGGTQLLFSIAAAINCVAEVFVYYFSSTFIKRIGHIRVLYVALVCYSLRLYYYGLLSNPWYVLAAEPLSGITTAAAWAAMTSFVGLNATPESVTTLQGILHGVHWGLGHGCGELLGGFMVSWLGAAMTFNVFGSTTIIMLFLFMLINWFSGKKKEIIKDGVSEEAMTRPCCE